MPKSKKKPKTYWNHRIVTRIHPSAKNSPELNQEDFRIFSITEVHYKNDKPKMYACGLSMLSEMESIEGLKWTLKKLKKVFDKPILDLDNWPNEWKPEKKK